MTTIDMPRAEVLEVLGSWLKVMEGLPGADAVADLIQLAYPDSIARPGLGFGDPLWMIQPRVEAVLQGWEFIARQNTPAAVAYRDGVDALRQCLELAKASAREAA